MSNIVLKPKEQKKLEKKLEKLSLMIGGLSTPTTSVRLHSMITDIGILVANADMDAKSQMQRKPYRYDIRTICDLRKKIL